MNIDQISELLSLMREINERLARIEGIVQAAGMTAQTKMNLPSVESMEAEGRRVSRHQMEQQRSRAREQK